MPRLRSRDSLRVLGFGGPAELSRSRRAAETRTWQLPWLPPRAAQAHEENWLHNRMPVECLPAGQATKILRARIFLPHFFCRVLSMPGAVLMNSIWGCVLSFLLCPLLTSPKAASFPLRFRACEEIARLRFLAAFSFKGHRLASLHVKARIGEDYEMSRQRCFCSAAYNIGLCRRDLLVNTVEKKTHKITFDG